jgi:hypothetical protein
VQLQGQARQKHERDAHLLRNLRAGFAHGKADVRSLESRGVIRAVTRYANDSLSRCVRACHVLGQVRRGSCPVYTRQLEHTLYTTPEACLRAAAHSS